jgi:hypothetical protein
MKEGEETKTDNEGRRVLLVPDGVGIGARVAFKERCDKCEQNSRYWSLKEKQLEFIA